MSNLNFIREKKMVLNNAVIFKLSSFMLKRTGLILKNQN
jgi:hypothetical protein